MTGRGGAEPPQGVLSRFPEREALIRSRFSTDEGFRELCGDYAECVLLIERLRRDQGESGERFEQYCELRANLEQELLRQIPGRESALQPLPAPGTAAGRDLPEEPRTSPADSEL